MKKQYQLPRKFGEKWVEALREGTFKQDCEIEQLRQDDCYCVLGVAAEINNFKFDSDGINATNENGQDIYTVIDVFGENKKYSGSNSLSTVIYRLNDNEKLSFPEIADWIETNVEFI